MKNIRIVSAITLVCSALSASATDYSTLEGKCGAELKEAIKSLSSSGLKTVSYGDKTWDAFEQTDVRMIDGREAWFDMYSNRLVFVSDGHGGMNIEHSVANSWWGGNKNNAYKDLYHLNPSDADANNRKNNNPLGEIEGRATWSNGLTRIGQPTVATGGGSTTVFEPADEFKGDFARAYFYVFTLYDDISWESEPAWMYELSAYPTLKPWAYEMLLKWAAEDPVDEREITRARAVAGIQKNVNPYVELPDLAEYVWGSKKTTSYHYSEPEYAPNRPEAPTFGDYTVAGVNTWVGRWWESVSLTLSAPEGEIYYTLTDDDDDFELYEGQVVIGAAGESGETVTVRAFARTQYKGHDYDSPVSTLTLTAREAGETDYMYATWRKVTMNAELNPDDLYIITSKETPSVMSSTGGTGAQSFMSVAGSVVVSDDEISMIPEGSAVIKLLPAGGELYYISVNDITLRNIGMMAPTEARKMSLREQGVGATFKFRPDKTLEIDFGGGLGKLQYNQTSPRFLNYTSTQKDIAMWRCVATSSSVEMNDTAEPTEVEAVLYDLQGRRVDAAKAMRGIYIEVRGTRARKIIK